MAHSQKKKRRHKPLVTDEACSWEQLIDLGQQALIADKPKEAVDAFKQALRKGALERQVQPLLFKAYLKREAQLRAKGMNSEADVVRRQAQSHAPAAADLDEAGLLALAPGLSLPELFDGYRNYLRYHAPSPAIERRIAGALLHERRWELLAGLDDSLGLKAHGPAALSAAEHMHAGLWEQALECLHAVPRTSPYAPARLFCRAMSAFYRQDDTTMRQVLSLVPADDPLAPLAHALDRNPTKLPSLWEGPGEAVNDAVAALVTELRGGHFRKAADSVLRVAAALLPQEPWRACRHLLEFFWPMVHGGHLPYAQYQQMVHRCLDKDEADLLLAKTAYYAFALPIPYFLAYWKQIPNEFQDCGDADKAKALLISHALDRIRTSHGFIWFQTSQTDMLRHEMHIAAESIDIPIAMLGKAIALDPENRDIYQALAGCPRDSRQAKKWVEEGLLTMCEHFPEDPYPCLELATLYQEKGAFRKAEKIMQEALRRAPHDRRVSDRHVISLLISFKKHIDRGNPHLAAQDLDKAARLGGRTFGYFCAAKQMSLAIEQRGQLSLFGDQPLASPDQVRAIIDSTLEPLCALERFKALALLIMDSNQRAFSWKPSVIKQIRSALQEQATRFHQWSSPQILGLLSPLPRECAPLTGNQSLAAICLEHAPNLLSGIADSDIVNAIDLVVQQGLLRPAIAEIKRRRKLISGLPGSLLDFYHVALRQIAGDTPPDLEAFQKAIKSAKPQEHEGLRAASRRLAPHARGFLQEALATFDFERPTIPWQGDGPLPRGFPGEFCLDTDDDEDEDGWEDDSIGDAVGMLMDLMETANRLPGGRDALKSGMFQEQMIALAEAFVDQMGIRHLPEWAIVGAREDLFKKDPQMIRQLLLFGKCLTPKSIKALSDPAWAFFLGKE